MVKSRVYKSESLKKDEKKDARDEYAEDEQIDQTIQVWAGFGSSSPIIKLKTQLANHDIRDKGRHVL